MSAVRQREANDAGVSRRVRRRGIEHVPARPASASAVLSSDSDANPTQSQAASWHPSQIRPGWFIRGSGVDIDTDDEPHGRSQPEAAAGANAPPVAALQSAAQPRCLLNAAARQASDRGDLASQHPGHEVPVADVAAGVPSDAPRRLTRSLTRHALRRARTDDDVPADNISVLPAGEGVLAAQEDGTAQPLLQHSRLSSHGSLADSGQPGNEGPGALQHASDSQRSGRGGSAAPAAAAAQRGTPDCAAATGMQRITRFFAPLTALMGAHGSQQQSEAAAVGAMAAAGPVQGQEEGDDGTAPIEVTSAERRMASQPVASQRDRALASRSPSRVPPSQLAFLDREGLQSSQHSIEVSLSAAGPAQPSPGFDLEAATANGAAFGAPSQHLPAPEQAQLPDRQGVVHVSQAVAEPTAAEAMTEDTPATAALCRQRNLALDRIARDNVSVGPPPPDMLRVLIPTELRACDFSHDEAEYDVPGVEDAACWDQHLELNLFEVRA